MQNTRRQHATKEAPATPAAAPARRLPMKTAMILGAVLLLEGAAISGAFIFSGGPRDANAQTEAAQLAADGEKTVEVPVVSDRFQNARTGRTYLYDTEIYAVVKRKHQAEVKEQVKAAAAQFTADVGVIFRRAEPSDLLEPTLASLTQQIMTALSDRLGKDAEGKPLVEEVLIKKYAQYRGDT